LRIEELEARNNNLIKNMAYVKDLAIKKERYLLENFENISHSNGFSYNGQDQSKIFKNLKIQNEINQKHMLDTLRDVI
jgi:hypothetical protein